MNKIDAPSGLPICYSGPPLSAGKLPAFFYFALSAEESLSVDPFNQPVACLASLPMRVFSFTIPGHGKGWKNSEAMAYWADEINQGRDPLTPFFEQCLENIHFLIQNEIVDSTYMATGGLSRGGFVALHLASRLPKLTAVVAFAPLTTLKTIQEFSRILQLQAVVSLEIDKQGLTEKAVRFYIGNRDLRVDTDMCFQFARELTELNYAHHIRSPNVTLEMIPSIGHKGHGTPPGIFKAGAEWIASLLTEKSL